MTSILEVTQDEVRASKKGSKCAKMKTNVQFENMKDSYVKFCLRIEKNDEKMRVATKKGDCVQK